jgi:hypothetical protein
MKAWFGKHRLHIAGAALALVLIAVAYFVGKGSVDTHSAELSDLQSELRDVGGELRSEQGKLSLAEGEVAVAKEQVAEVEEELAAERSFKGRGEKQQVVEREYETDFPWQAAGRVGHFIFKPVGWEKEGENWLLKVEAKNESHEPKSPFCGGGESVVIDAENNNYSGQSVLFGASSDCSGELQPGTTETFEAEFKIPSNAAPVAVAIYGEFEQEEEAKTWELPR